LKNIIITPQTHESANALSGITYQAFKNPPST